MSKSALATRSIPDLVADEATSQNLRTNPVLAEHDGPQSPAFDNDESEELLSPSREIAIPAHLKRQLYVSHFLSTWNSRFFEFGAILFLAAIFPGTLLPISLYAMTRAAAAIILSPIVGKFIDRTERLRVVRLSILGQRVAVSLSCVAFFVLLVEDLNIDAVRITSMVLLACLAGVEKLCSIMNAVAVERDWVVVIAAGSETELGVYNAQMRRIDLLCKLVGPVVVSLLDAWSTKRAVLITLALNVASVPVEYFSIAKVYGMSPALQAPQCAVIHDQTEQRPSESTIKRFSYKHLARNSKSAFKIIADYYHHSAFLPSLALALLYYNVLNFGGQMVGYLLSAGFSSVSLGPIRTASVILEMSSTWIAPAAVRKVGSVRAALWLVNWQLFSLVTGVVLFWNLESPFLASFCLLFGVIVSRVGLWGFDLAVQSIIQGLVEPEHRGSFSTMEASIRNLFSLCCYATTAVFSRPDQFQYPALLSLLAVCSCSALYARFVRNTRGHILHVPCTSTGGNQAHKSGIGGKQPPRASLSTTRSLEEGRLLAEPRNY